jgi:hypothetical protein
LVVVAGNAIGVALLQELDVLGGEDRADDAPAGEAVGLAGIDEVELLTVPGKTADVSCLIASW